MTNISRAAALTICAVALSALPATAQVVSGEARGADGDTLEMTDVRIRLLGIDAVELGQSCTRGSETWACGAEATAALNALVAGKVITCAQTAIDPNGRWIATCQAGDLDLGLAMIESGLAIALANAPSAYHAAETSRRDARLGIWGGQFTLPADWRAAHPRAEPAIRRQSVAIVPRTRAAVRATGPFKTCGDAWRAGAAPFYRGQPGYRSDWDGDRDGIACEPKY